MRENHAASYGKRNLRLPARNTRRNLSQEGKERMDVLPGLGQRVFSAFLLVRNPQAHVLGIGLYELIQPPILDFKDNEPAIGGEKKEIRFTSLNVRRIPHEKLSVRPGSLPQKAIGLALARRGKGLNLRRKHRGHAGCLPDLEHADVPAVLTHEVLPSTRKGGCTASTGDGCDHPAQIAKKRFAQTAAKLRM